ncbi:MAG: lipoyl synthase [Elusimicrobia bacterium]|nr:lipoyl synthase [Elusimicrobiota bacterium]
MSTPFLKKRINLGTTTNLKKTFKKNKLHTVCESAKCPNISECFDRKVATFLILGDICTRFCSFCGIEKGKPFSLDKKEPKRIAENIQKLKISYAVITSVTRDDLKDGGAKHFVNTVSEVRKLCPETKIEILVPDFSGKKESFDIIFSCRPDILSHNVETVPRLYSKVRRGADYKRSLELLTAAGDSGLKTKSGIMLGLGEKEEEIFNVMDDLIKARCKILTLGQYLSPSKAHYDVYEYVSEESFNQLKEIALNKGFEYCASGPYVRSSYLAESMI